MEKRVKALKTKVADVNESGIVTIQVTQFDSYDSDNDRLLRGSLTKTWNEGKQVHLLDHKMGMSTFVGLPVKKDAVNGIIESKINLNKQIGKDLLADYKFSLENGRSLQHSHGFMPIKGKYEENEKGGYDFAEVKQMEYSTVLFGAVEDTPVHAIKSKSDALELIDLLELKLRTMNISDEYALTIEKNINDLKTLVKGEPLEDTHENRAVLNTQGITEIFNNFKIN